VPTAWVGAPTTPPPVGLRVPGGAQFPGSVLVPGLQLGLARYIVTVTGVSLRFGALAATAATADLAMPCGLGWWPWPLAR
jgi:hypothetical protein